MGAGTGLALVAAAGALLAGPAAAAGADLIALASARDGDGEISVARADGGALRRLTDNRAEDRFPAWSPDGSRIAFVSDRGGDEDVWVMLADGSGARVLTRDRARAAAPPPPTARRPGRPTARGSPSPAFAPATCRDLGDARTAAACAGSPAPRRR